MEISRKLLMDLTMRKWMVDSTTSSMKNWTMILRKMMKKRMKRKKKNSIPSSLTFFSHRRTISIGLFILLNDRSVSPLCRGRAFLIISRLWLFLYMNGTIIVCQFRIYILEKLFKESPNNYRRIFSLARFSVTQNYAALNCLLLNLTHI